VFGSLVLGIEMESCRLAIRLMDHFFSKKLLRRVGSSLKESSSGSARRGQFWLHRIAIGIVMHTGARFRIRETAYGHIGDGIKTPQTMIPKGARRGIEPNKWAAAFREEQASPNVHPECDVDETTSHTRAVALRARCEDHGKVVKVPTTASN
jgi:hypothetical protein